MSPFSKKPTASSGSSASSASKLDYLKKYMGKGGSAADGGALSLAKEGKKKRSKTPGSAETSRMTGFRLNDASEEVDVRAPSRKRQASSLRFDAAQFGRVLCPTMGARGKAYAYQLDEEDGSDSDGSEQHQEDEEIVVVDADGRNVALNELQAKRVHAIVRDQEAREVGLSPKTGVGRRGFEETEGCKRHGDAPLRGDAGDTTGREDDESRKKRSGADACAEGAWTEKSGASASSSGRALGLRGSLSVKQNDIDLSVFNAPVGGRLKPRSEAETDDSLGVDARPDLSPPRRRPHSRGLPACRDHSGEKGRDERGSLERGANRRSLSPAPGPGTPQDNAVTSSTAGGVSGKTEREDLSPPRRRPLRSGESSAGRDGADKQSSTDAGRDRDLSPRRASGREGSEPASVGAAAPRSGQLEDLSLPRRRPPSSAPSDARGSSASSSSHFPGARAGRQARSPERRTDDLSPPRKRTTDWGKGNETSGREEMQQRSDSGPKSTGLLTLDDYRASGVGSEKEPSLLTKDLLAREVVRQVVYRDRQGRVITEEEWLELQDQKRGKRRKKERSPPPELEWGKGIVQKEAREKQAQEEAKIAQQPLARYEIDDDYDRSLQDRSRWEDPMNRVPQKADESPTTPANPERPKEKEHPKCPHDAPRNRFGILPGYRWDGVVRGNGYEDRRLKAINRKKLEAHMAHMNNVADM
ncbi:Pre-mRNA-splicing factor CWC26, related [Neospora caninum Liverpool]|uniref:Pre-mRNA-splicing factor CWC26, related n=1 Tax=Neospora caninum (strain Liverpool) TaxID=572307 RepID=F0VFW2_NEOCL|nr:Pre-mRNA-splicing factor CWC26, related [Neospora caninum Liverpool]CBZ52606.1 Pre-mRNA-splicing factor CWC26, related [Neospora caninum Liverpool]CEL66585.1 TPA: Pre-mRNA-splicing factor CWC26, related [Neospora caninum Liverpool]|eukprot:XP_003882638.1 Pre-mRNA-splicing factor CWC26, related [Neospora caninum Liverpool]